MTEKMIRDAYCRIRTIDHTIPDDVLDFMKDAAIERIKETPAGFSTLQSENERLREALIRIAERTFADDIFESDIDIAKKALAQTPGQVGEVKNNEHGNQ